MFAVILAGVILHRVFLLALRYALPTVPNSPPPPLPNPAPIPSRGYCHQADTANGAIRIVDVASGLVTTLAGSTSQTYGHADGAGTAATFYNPIGIAMDAAGTFALVVRGGSAN